MGKPKVLLVDDEPDIVRTLGFRLEAAGYEVLTAANGAEALEHLRRGKVDLVLADFMMPEMNGIELTRVIKESPLWFDIKVLLFSANSEPEFRRKAIEMGACDYLPKTLGAQAIVEKVTETIGVAAPPAPAAAAPNTGPQLAALARSLSDVLHMAGAAEGLPESTTFGIEAAKRIAGEIQSLAGAGEN